jgi:outer membrane protein assembly factor BamB
MRTLPTVRFAMMVLGLGAALAAPAAHAAPPAPAADTGVRWPQFRGPDSLPVSDNASLPSRWSKKKNVEWVTEIPGMGWSSPIVWDDRVFLTSAMSEKDMKQPSLGVDFSNDYVAELMKEGKTEQEVHALLTARDLELPDEIALSYRLFCLELGTGKLLWEREIYKGPPPVGRHRKNSYTSETPVTDGKAVYVYIGHLGLFAYDFAGEKLWQTTLESHKVYLDFGGGSSPALHDGKLYILNDNEEASFVAAYDSATGNRLWHTLRPGLGMAERHSGWSTPYVWVNPVRTEVVTVGPNAAISYDLEGRELWRLTATAHSAIQTPFAWNGLLYLASGSSGERVKPMVAIRPGASGLLLPPDAAHEGGPEGGAEGGAPSPSIAWYNPDAGGSYLPTPLIYDGRLYVLSDKGILDQYDPLSGERVYRTRIDREARNFTASPWAYDGKIFALNEEGITFVIAAGESFELLSTNRLDEFAMATPALAGDRLLIRTQSKLYSIRGAD